MKVVQKVLSFSQKEHFLCDNTLPLLTKLEKEIQLSVLITVRVRTYKGERYAKNLKKMNKTDFQAVIKYQQK